MTSNRKRAVSPVVAVILLVAVTVGLSAVVGAFTLNLGSGLDSGTSDDIGVQTSTDGTTLTVHVVTGSADRLAVLVNGSEAHNISNVTPGDSVSVAASEDESVSVVTVSDGKRHLVASGISGSDGGVPATGLVNHWRFDDSSTPNTAIDFAGGNDGVLTGGRYVFDGTRSTVLELNNSSRVESGQLPISGDKSVSITGWFKVDNISNAEPTVAYVGNDPNDFPEFNILSVDGDGSDVGTIQSWIADSNGFHRKLTPATPTVDDGKWHQFAVVKNASAYKLYLDGQMVASNSSGGAQPVPADAMYIGDVPNRDYEWDGRLGDIRTYDRALSKKEVESLYQNEK